MVDANRLTTGQVAKLLGLTNVNPHQTVLRWQTAGVIIRGTRVFLGSTRLGRCRYSTAEQVREFLATCNAGNVPTCSESAAEERRRDEKGQRLLAERLAGKR